DPEDAMDVSMIPLDYATLRVVWWLLLGVLLIGFAVMDGFDLGVAALLPVVARTDEERRVALNLVGPVWEGNQVWLITGGGAVFGPAPGPAPAAGGLDPASGRLQAPPQGAGSALAPRLGSAAVRLRPGRQPGVRRGHGQPAAGPAVRRGGRFPAPGVRGQPVPAVHALRPARRPGQRGHA